jgi:hypothetical protein
VKMVGFYNAVFDQDGFATGFHCSFIVLAVSVCSMV